MTMFVLSLLIADGSMEEEVCKRGMIRAGGPCYVKMVFTSLTKAIAVYVQFSIV